MFIIGAGMLGVPVPVKRLALVIKRPVSIIDATTPAATAIPRRIPFSSPINLSSEGMVTLDMIIRHIEDKTMTKAIIDMTHGSKSPFHEFHEKTFSLNMDKARQLGWHSSQLHDWFWKLLDEYITRALKRR